MSSKRNCWKLSLRDHKVRPPTEQHQKRRPPRSALPKPPTSTAATTPPPPAHVQRQHAEEPLHTAPYASMPKNLPTARLRATSACRRTPDPTQWPATKTPSTALEGQQRRRLHRASRASNEDEGEHVSGLVDTATVV